MKTSIQTKLFLVLGGSAVLFVLLSIGLNVFFLEDYYVWKNKDYFETGAEQIKEQYKSSPKQFTSYIEFVDREESISIQVASPDGTILYSSFTQKKQGNAAHVPKEVEEYMQKQKSVNTPYGIIEKKDKSLPKLAYILELDDGNALILTKSIKGIRESVSISIQFLMIAGGAIVVIYGLFVFFFSRRATKPIITMSLVAEGISNLDFDKKIRIKSKDELGVLADSINTIADKLKINIEQLKKDIAFQKMLTRNISHELKTPIGIIKGYTEGILYGVADTKEGIEQYGRVIVSECNRMDAMVIEMLDLSALEAKDATLRSVDTFAVSSIIQSVQERFEPLFQTEKIDFRWELEKDLEITADYELLLRAISNIVMNAVKYNDENRQVRLSANEKEGMLFLSVYNTGERIPKEELEKIWDAFYKVDKARTRKVGGHGLGLSIVKSIITLHGGMVWAENRENGMVFYISIPISPEFHKGSLESQYHGR